MYNTFVYIYDTDVSRRMRSIKNYSFVFADGKSVLTEGWSAKPLIFFFSLGI